MEKLKQLTTELLFSLWDLTFTVNKIHHNVKK